jgi:Rab family protein
VEFATKPVPLKTGGTVRVQIWDTGKSLDNLSQLDHSSVSGEPTTLPLISSNVFTLLVAGQERFKAITSAHYRKSLGALLVYDITKE